MFFKYEISQFQLTNMVTPPSKFISGWNTLYNDIVTMLVQFKKIFYLQEKGLELQVISLKISICY